MLLLLLNYVVLRVLWLPPLSRTHVNNSEEKEDRITCLFDVYIHGEKHHVIPKELPSRRYVGYEFWSDVCVIWIDFFVTKLPLSGWGAIYIEEKTVTSHNPSRMS